jgi:hypothetical protein
VPPLVEPPRGGIVVRRANDDEQKALELGAATWLTASTPPPAAPAQFLLDPLAFALAWDEEPRRDNVFFAHTLPSHTPEHLSVLSTRLGAAGVMDGSRSCMVFRPSACRAASGAGTIAFTVGIFRGDTAEIAIFRTTGDARISAWSLKATVSGGFTVISHRTSTSITP